jgi:hypothetical protein
VRGALRASTIVAAYAVVVGGVLAALLLAVPDDPWLAVLAAMAVVHLGFGLIVARWWTVLLPVLVSVVAVIADVGGFSITTLLVGLPCAMLLFAGVALRIGWDDGGRAREPMPSFEEEVTAWDGREAYLRDHPDEVAWDDAEHAESWGR